jgi:hypothetical protein
MTITSGGAVGIGTSSPSFSNGSGLEVANATTACVRIEGNSAAHAVEIYADSSGGTIDARGTDAVLAFDIGGSEAARITAAGLTFNGDTAASNALDDYEEGTFTPSFISGATGITYTEQSGRYTKIGNMVHFQIFLDVNASTTNSGGVQIGGLPFTSFNGQPLPSYSIGYNNNFHGGGHTLTALGNSNTTTISLYQDDGSSLTGSESNFGNDLYISGSYIAA